MKVQINGNEIEFDLSTSEKRIWLFNQLASRLDGLVGEIEDLDGQECMRGVATLVKKILEGDPVIQYLTSMVVASIAGHALHHARKDIETWGDYWSRLSWQSAASLLTCSYAARRYDELSQAKLHLGIVAVSLLESIEVMDLARLSPETFHWNHEPKVPLDRDTPKQAEVIRAARKKAAEAAKGYAERLKSI